MNTAIIQSLQKQLHHHVPQHISICQEIHSNAVLSFCSHEFQNLYTQSQAWASCLVILVSANYNSCYGYAPQIICCLCSVIMYICPLITPLAFFSKTMQALVDSVYHVCRQCPVYIIMSHIFIRSSVYVVVTIYTLKHLQAKLSVLCC